MIIPDLSRAVWRKSSRSGSNAACVEIAVVPGVEWRKSSRSGTNSNCVEVAVAAETVAVRDSKDPGGAVLAFAANEWSGFLAGLKDGRFDQR